MKAGLIQSLIELNYLTLPYLPISEKASLPQVPVIYFVVENDELVYIGKANNLFVRWNKFDHYSETLCSSSANIHWLKVNKSELTLTEALLVAFYEPKYNKVIPQVTEKSGFTEQDVIDAYNLGFQKGLIQGVSVGKASLNKLVEKCVNKQKYSHKSIVLTDENQKNKVKETILNLKEELYSCPRCQSSRLGTKGKFYHKCLDCKKTWRNFKN
jgi:hypothetical protein